MEIRVLGIVEASIDGRPVALGGAKQRAVLAMLGLEANRPVTADRLVEGLWGEEPPPSASKMVQNYVWRLRRTLDEDEEVAIVTRGRAYELRIDRDHVDACRLERLVAEAAQAAEAGRPDDAARAALALFRGEPLADVADEPFAGAEIRRLQELHLTAAELAIEADLAAGHHHDALGEAERLLADNPLREPLHAQRMLALYRGGRQAEALAAYGDARRTLVEQVGVEPTPELRRLHDAILHHDPALDAAPVRTQLPPELDSAGAPALVGRDDELRRLGALWRRGGALVTVTGPDGIGKTRLAAELAGEAHRAGASVVHATGDGPATAVRAAIDRTRAARGSALLVVEEADRGPEAVRVALRDLGRELDRTSVLVLATGQETAELARIEPRESLALEPLDAASVAAIARTYAPSGAATPPAEELLAASDGVPRRVHEAASEWARREAARRVDEAARRAVAHRAEARALDAELAGSVAELQAAREPAVHDWAQGPLVCPYKGLAAFDTDDASYFSGRERLVAELVAHLVGTPLLAVVGPSGAGKSSVVRAGLLPALAAGVLPGSERWTQALMRPGTEPASELRRATCRVDHQARAVLVVDQFEELFTACEDEAQRQAFVAALVRDPGNIVVVVVRAEFYGRCAPYADLAALMGANHVLVGPMARDELARAIEQPAQRAGLSVDPELVRALLDDVEGQPGALPLLSTTLLELWGERDGRNLRLAVYTTSGGVRGAVARLAENAFVELDPARQAAARRVLLRLVDDEEGGALVRRRIGVDELESERDREVAARLADRRLLTIGDGAVEVAHEALFAEWPRLRAWLEEDAQGRRVHRRLGAAARAWGAGEGELYRGARLAAALEWAAGRESELHAIERAFLDASRRASTRAQRRLRGVLAGVASLAVLAVVACVIALDQRAHARDQAVAAAAESVGAQALAEGDLAKALLLARQGVALHDSPQTRANLLTALLESPAVVGVLSGHGAGFTSLALSPDGRTLVVTDDRGGMRFVDARTRRDIGSPGALVEPPTGPSEGVLRFSAVGSRLAVGGHGVAILDPRTRAVVSPNRPIDGVWVDHLAFAPDGRTVLAIVRRAAPAPSVLVRDDVRTALLRGAPVAIGGAAGTTALMVGRHGGVVTSRAGGPTVVRDPRTLRPIRRFGAGSTEAALAPDDRTVLLGGADGSVRWLDLVSGRVRTGSGRHDGAVVRATFSADGRFAATAGEDNRVIVWDVAHAVPRETLSGHTARITDLALSSDDRTLYSAALDGETLIWDLGGDRRLGRPFATGPATPLGDDPRPEDLRYALSSDGALLAVGHDDGTVTVIDARTLRRLASFRGVPRGEVRSLGFVPGGGPLVVGGDDGFLALRDPRRGTLLQRPAGVRGAVVRISVAANGRRMAALGDDGSVALWTLGAGRAVGPPLFPRLAHPFTDVGLSADAGTLALNTSVEVELIDSATLRPRATLAGGQWVSWLGPFTPDGGELVGAAHAGWTRLWSTETGRPVTRELAGHTGPALWESVSPDGRTLATGGTDGVIRLFDLGTQQPLGAPLPALPNHAVAPVFTPDGAHLLAITDAGRGVRWDVRPASWERHACAVAGRTLTRAEWRDALPDLPYAPACGR